MKLVVVAVLLAAVAICQAIPYPDKTQQEPDNTNPVGRISSEDSMANGNKYDVLEIGSEFLLHVKFSHSIQLGGIAYSTSASKIEIANNTQDYVIPAITPSNVSHVEGLSQGEYNTTTSLQWINETTAATPLNRSANTEQPYQQNLTAVSSGEGLSLGATTPSQILDSVLWMAATRTTAAEYADRALVAGHEGWDGSPLCIIRALHNGALLPGKLAIKHKASYVPFHGKEVGVDNFQILLADPDSVQWLPSSNGRYPHKAIPAGFSDTGEILYICRVPYQKSTTPGLLHPSRQNCYISFRHQEISFKDYEVLCNS